MKRLIGILVFALISSLCLPSARAQEFSDDQQPPEEGQDVPPVTLDAFYDALSPYGEWVNIDAYGPCWRPSAAVVGGQFRPYATGGQWIYTTNGWEFQSQWEWGNIVFHYGRWYQDADYGWLWVPGTDWAPSWVDWRDNDEYIGWAPLGPGGLATPVDAGLWLFVPIASFTAPEAYTSCVDESDFQRVYVSTQPVRRVVAVHTVPVNRGPPVAVVKAVGVAVPVRQSARAVPVVPVNQMRRSYLTPAPGSRPGARVPMRAPQYTGHTGRPAAAAVRVVAPTSRRR